MDVYDGASFITGEALPHPSAIAEGCLERWAGVIVEWAKAEEPMRASEVGVAAYGTQILGQGTFNVTEIIHKMRGRL